MKKVIKFIIIVLMIVMLSVIIISHTKNTYRYVTLGSSSSVYIHDKYVEVDSNGNQAYF